MERFGEFFFRKSAIFALFFVCVQVFCDTTYTVKKGDTLYSISRSFQITVPELRAANNLSENDVLREGARLVVPSPDISNAAALSEDKGAVKSKENDSPSAPKIKTTSYTIQKGDTLYGIARSFGAKLSELLSVNNLDNTATIKVGQKILVPDVEKPSQVTSNADFKKDAMNPLAIPASFEKNDGRILENTGVSWPLENPTIKTINGKVSGVQLSGREDEAVRVVREGTVMYTGVYRGFGEIVFVQSKTGLIYSYSGLGRVSAKKGDYVLFGDEIGRTGRGADSSIKFMVFQNGMPIDPMKAPRD